MPPAVASSNFSSALPLALQAALDSGAPIVAPSTAAARQLRAAFDAARRSRGLLAWEPAPVLSWSQWLDALWSEAIVSGAETRLLLNEAQEHSLWADIVSSATQPNATQPNAVQPSATQPSDATAAALLTSADSLADLARSAWNLANAYAAAARLRASATTHDSRVFAAWAEAFARECERRDCLSRAGLEAGLQAHIAAATLAVPPRLHLAGFGEITPAQQNLLDALRSAGAEISLHETFSRDAAEAAQPSQASRAIVRANDELEELHAIARWVRRFLEERQAQQQTRKQASGQPPRVGVLFPSLDTDRAAVEAVFREVLAPELQPIGCDLSSTPYEFATGRPLASLPLIAVALDLARWAEDPLPIGNVSALLLSPYLGGLAGQDRGAQDQSIQDQSAQDQSAHDQSAQNQSVQFDAFHLRRMKLLRPEISLLALFDLARRSAYGAAPLAWLSPLRQFVQRAGDLAATRSFAEWAEFFRGLVQSANWPGGRPLTSDEFHATRAWDDALDALATLDFRGRRVVFREALRALERQAGSAGFNPPPTGAPVQIMGPANADGLSFDALIFARATDTNFPAPERANPLLGWGLQASLDMPGASRSRAAERSRQRLERLLASAGDVLITYARENADGPQRLSPALAELAASGWPQQDALAPLTPGRLAPASIEPAEEETVEEEMIDEDLIEEDLVEDRDPLPPLPSPLVRGGARVLQLQAACGFRAFAEMRLGAARLDTVAAGFDAPESGSALHRTMERFWASVKTQAALRELTPPALQQLIASCVDEAMRPLSPQNDWDEAYLALQRQRLVSLVRQWLEKELERSPFTVLQRELEQPIEIGPLTLDVRFDRIDRVKEGAPDEGFVLVDYKTGSSGHPGDWEGERPDDPQLPLYALPYAPQELKALAFAKVRVGEMKWLGYQTEAGILPTSRANANPVVALSAIIEEWRATLLSLAQDFAAGDAAVRPKQYPQTCKHCAQRLLCRVDPAALLDAQEDGEAAEASDG